MRRPAASEQAPTSRSRPGPPCWCQTPIVPVRPVEPAGVQNDDLAAVGSPARVGEHGPGEAGQLPVTSPSRAWCRWVPRRPGRCQCVLVPAGAAATCSAVSPSRARGHARLAADADFLAEIDEAVLAAEHRLGRAVRHTGPLGALVAAGHLENAACLQEHRDVHGLDVGPPPRPGPRSRSCSRRARVTSDAPVPLEHLPPARKQTARWHHDVTVREVTAPRITRHFLYQIQGSL